MKKKYKSKIGIELIIPLVFILFIISFLIISHKAWYLGFVFLFPVVSFMTHMILTTYYIIENEMLEIRCGFFYYKKVDIQTIKRISKTKNPISSPATSIDRIELFYNRFDSVLISPKLSADFIQDIKNINPNIELHL